MLDLSALGKALFSSLRKKDDRSDRAAAIKQARLISAITAAPIGIALATIDGLWLHFNEAFRALLGYSREELGRLTFVALTHPEDAKRELALVKRMLAGEAESYRIEKRVVDKRGRHHTIYVSAAICRAKPGEPPFFVYIADAIRARTESGHDADRFSASILEQMTDVAVIRTDSRGLITGWNAGAQRMFGYRADEVITKHRRILYRDADAWGDKPEAQVATASTQRRAEVDDFRVRRDGTEVFVKSVLTAFAPDGMVRGFVETISQASGAEVIDTSRVLNEMRAELEKERKRSTELVHRNEELQVSFDKSAADTKAVRMTLRDEAGRRKVAEEMLEDANRRAEELMQVHASKGSTAFTRPLEMSVEIESEMPDPSAWVNPTPTPKPAPAPALHVEEPPLPEMPSIFESIFESAPASDWMPQGALDLNPEPEPLPAPPPVFESEPVAAAEPIAVTAAIVHAPPTQPIDYEWNTLHGKELFERMASFAREKRTGVFIATDGERERAILFVSGAILSCASDDPGMLLSERLVADGLIDRTMRAKALDVVEETHLSFGRVLLLMDAITEQELLAALRRKIDEEIEAIAGWGSMQWTFIDRAQPEGKLVPMSIEVDTIIRRLRRRPHKPQWMATAKGRKYHNEKCVMLVRYDESERIVFANERAAVASGLTPCNKCVPAPKPKQKHKPAARRASRR
jgi:PAS domain S-box-containing protein